ncbi:MAG TPA: amidohydrolase family protein [Candidatus Tectomicrobia bacterium]|nr:amidohydrolase family protein [Candidatus Tectomicrobia bacterium]
MSTLVLRNIGALVTGVLAAPRAEASAIRVQDGIIAAVGGADVGRGDAEVVVDCRGTTVIPGLVDSHCHVVLGDYTPRQKQVDFLDSYVHGGITTVVSAGEGVHAPGRPHDPAASKALAIAAAKCFAGFRPNGMKVVAGSVVLEPGLTDEDFAEMARHGVGHAKYGFGAYAHPDDGAADVRRAQRHGLCVMSHSGGTSIPGSSPITHETLLRLRPDVCGHVNGGTTSLDDDGLARLVRDSGMALQVVQAGNLRSALLLLRLAREAGALDRVCLASDTPTGTGVMPLGVLKTVCELASLGGIAPEVAIALATGNNARAFRLDTGRIEVGAPADLVVCDAPVASMARDALGAIARGDIPGISCVVIDGRVRVGRSRNTPLATRLAEIHGVPGLAGGHEPGVGRTPP